jgi:hypothetical protein
MSKQYYELRVAETEVKGTWDFVALPVYFSMFSII